jgi:hypothetical protein
VKKGSIKVMGELLCARRDVSVFQDKTIIYTNSGRQKYEGKNSGKFFLHMRERKNIILIRKRSFNNKIYETTV